jgi:hypothetical protein
MKLKLIFGLGGPIKTFSWHQDIDKFYRVLSVGGVRHSFANYHPDANKEFDYIVYYWSLDPVDPKDDPIPTFEEISGDAWGYNCECGSAYSSVPMSHANWCKKYSPY